MTSRASGDRLRITWAERIRPMPLHPGSIPVLANDLGMLSSVGIEMRVKEFVGSGQAVEAFRSGTVEMGQLSGLAAMRLAAEASPPVVIFWANVLQNPGIVLVSRSSIGKVSELRGKKIGVTATDDIDSSNLARLLRSSGVSSDEVTWVTGDPSERAEMLLHGRLDATLAAFQTYVVKLEGRKTVRILVDEKDLNPSGKGFLVGVSTKELVEREPETLARITTAFLKAARLFSRNSNAWIEAASRRRPDVPKDKIARLWQRHREEWPVNGGIDLKSFNAAFDAFMAAGKLGPIRSRPNYQWVTTKFEEQAMGELGG